MTKGERRLWTIADAIESESIRLNELSRGLRRELKAAAGKKVISQVVVCRKRGGDGQ